MIMSKAVYLKSFFLALIALGLFAGCGYHPVALHGPLAEANGVNVMLFVNKSYRPGVAGSLARSLIDQLALRSGGKVLPGDQAQLELTGVILSYTSTAVSYTALDTIREYKSALAVQAVLQDRQTHKVLWKGDLSEAQVFPVNSSIALQQNAEEAAIEKICRKLSEEIWWKIGEQF